MLVAADRINVVEGGVQDLGRGKLPNIAKELSIRAEWQHDKMGRVKKAADTALVAAVLMVWLCPKRKPARRLPPRQV